MKSNLELLWKYHSAIVLCRWFLKGMRGADKKINEIWINIKSEIKRIMEREIMQKKIIQIKDTQIYREILVRKIKREKREMYGEMKMKNSDMYRNREIKKINTESEKHREACEVLDRETHHASGVCAAPGSLYEDTQGHRGLGEHSRRMRDTACLSQQGPVTHTHT